MRTQRLALIALAALVVLLAGVVARDRLERSSHPPPASPPSGGSPLQQLSQDGQFRRASRFIARRAAEVAPFVLYLPDSRSSGVRWGGDTVLTTDHGRTLAVLSVPPRDTLAAPARVLEDTVANDWVLLAARTPDGRLASMAGGLAGSTSTTCGGVGTHELLLDAPLTPRFAGAGIFDIDGALLGLVVHCDERLIAIPVREIARRMHPPRATLTARALAGVSLAPLDSVARRYFRATAGALVVAVRDASAAAAAGVRPGDVVLSVDGVLPDVADTLTASTGASAGHVIRLLRGGRTVAVRIGEGGAAGPAAESALDGGIQLEGAAPAPGILIRAVRRGSPADRAGLRAGDRLVRIGRRTVSTPAAAARLLRTPLRSPVFVVYRRDATERGVFLHP